jgi:hypothetical protein
MARELRDVLHHFLEEPPPQPRVRRQAVLAVPLGERDMVHSAFLWNLAAELAREGADAVVVAPAQRDAGPTWAELGGGGGVRYVPTFAGNLGELAATVREVALPAAGRRGADALVLAEVPEEWLDEHDGLEPDDPLLAWSLLFTTPETGDLRRALRRAGQLLARCQGAQVGVTVHGVHHVDEARDAFLFLAQAAEQHLGRPLLSYGLLLDDLDVYRAIVEQRALGAVRPQCRAARALRDVARLIREDLVPADA